MSMPDELALGARLGKGVGREQPLMSMPRPLEEELRPQRLVLGHVWPLASSSTHYAGDLEAHLLPSHRYKDDR